MEENIVADAELQNILNETNPQRASEGITLDGVLAAEKVVADWKSRIALATSKLLGREIEAKALRARYNAEQKWQHNALQQVKRVARDARADQRLAVAMEREARAKAKYEANKPRMYDTLAEAVRADIKERRADFERRHNQTGGGIGFGNDFYIYNDVEVTDELVNEAIDKMDDKQLERISKTVNKV